MEINFPDAILKARAIIEPHARKMPGLSVAVSVKDTVVWQENFGYADVAAKVPVTSRTRFRVASVSKPFTAAGLALLVERGMIDLDAPVQQYLTDFPEKEGVITTRLLAGHLTGIRNYRGLEASCNKAYDNLRAGLKIFENDPLESAPGTKYSYSPYNWNVIGAIMEAVTGQDFPGYMADHVFKPLGMTETRADLPGVDDPRRAQFYEMDKTGEFIPAPERDHSRLWPAGGFLSTPEDMIRFGSAHLKPGFLKPQSLKTLFTAQKTTSGESTKNGIGWFIHLPVIYHGGDGFGATAVLLMVPAARIAVALASNGGRVIFLNALRQGKVSPENAGIAFNKVEVAGKIAHLFFDAMRK